MTYRRHVIADAGRPINPFRPSNRRKNSFEFGWLFAMTRAWPTASPRRARPTFCSTATTRSTGTPGATRPSPPRAPPTSRSSCPSATPPATGATSWSTSPSRTRRIAALMNELFVNIKVDREERPDVDAIYMNAIQVMGEGGGWPLSAFCTPAGEPFFLGTYFPPDDRYGRPGFARVLETMARVYARQARRRRAQRRRGARRPAPASTSTTGPAAGAGARRRRARSSRPAGGGRALAGRSAPTRVHGGFGSRPKFPSSSSHDLLGRAGRLRVRRAGARGVPAAGDRHGAGAASTITWAAASPATRWTSAGWCRTSRRCCTTTRQLLAIYGDAFAMTGEPLFAPGDRRDRGLARARDVRRQRRAVRQPRRRLRGRGGQVLRVDAGPGARGAGRRRRRPASRPPTGSPSAGNFEHGSTRAVRGSASAATPRASAPWPGCGRACWRRAAARVRPATDDKVLAAGTRWRSPVWCAPWEATGQPPALALARAGGRVPGRHHGARRRGPGLAGLQGRPVQARRHPRRLRLLGGGLLGPRRGHRRGPLVGARRRPAGRGARPLLRGERTAPASST